MKLRSSKIIRSPSANKELTSVVRIDALQDTDFSHRCASVEASDESSASFRGERVNLRSSGAECLPSDTTHSRRKWSYAENIELMHCFYLAKRDGVGYRNRLKGIWDTRNPSKASISVNTLCCHARNIQSSHMISEHELSNIAASCAGTSCANEGATNAMDPQPTGQIERNLPDSPKKLDCPGVSGESMMKFSEDDVSQHLEHKFYEVSAQNVAFSCLPRVTATKSVLDLVTNVNDSLRRVLEHSEPSLQQCVHLLYAAAATAHMMLPGSPARRSNKSWKFRLENTVSC